MQARGANRQLAPRVLHGCRSATSTSPGRGTSMAIRLIRLSRIACTALWILLLATVPARAQTPPPSWPPPAPAEPDDTLYKSPFTFESTSGGEGEEGEPGPAARIAARWEILGGPVSLPLSQAMAQAAEAERQAHAQQAPG